MGCADAVSVDGRRGSNVYEVNPWLWQFGRGKPRLGGLSVEATEGGMHEWLKATSVVLRPVGGARLIEHNSK